MSLTQTQITVTTSAGEVGEFILNHHEDRFVADALMDVKAEIVEAFGPEIVLLWGSPESPWGGQGRFSYEERLAQDRAYLAQEEARQRAMDDQKMAARFYYRAGV